MNSDRIYIEVRCFGNREALTDIAERINHDGGLRSHLFHHLGLDDFAYCDTGQADTVEVDGKPSLSFCASFEETWRDEDLQTCATHSDAIFEINTIEADAHWTNDTERLCFKPYFLWPATTEGEDLEGYFMKESDAVRFVRSHYPDIPEVTTTFRDLEAYCDNKGIVLPCTYFHLITDNRCTPKTKQVICCLQEAINAKQ